MIKIGIIGCGKITEVRHAPEYVENPYCELAGFFDVVPGRAREFADKFGGRAFATMEELLAQSDVDGGLIGGAALKPDQFVEIVNAANQE